MRFGIFPLKHLIILLIGTHARFQKKACHAHSIIVGANVERRVSKAGPFFDISTVIHLRGKIHACIGILMTYRNVSEKKERMTDGRTSILAESDRPYRQQKCNGVWPSTSMASTLAPAFVKRSHNVAESWA